MSDFGVEPVTNQPAPVLTPAPTVAPALPSLPQSFAAQIASNLSGQSTNPFTTPAAQPDNAPIVPPTFASQPTNTSALIPSLPQSRAAFVQKYTRLAPQLASLPTPVKSSLIAFDLARINKGQMPLSDDETLHTLSAAITGKATTPARHDTSLLGRLIHTPEAAVEDLGNVLKGGVRLIQPNRGNAIYQELFNNIPHWGKIYQENRRAELNPVAAFLQSPGIRFIPGSFVASNIASGLHGLGNLLDHPVFTALDVLPYASEAASLTKIGRVAAEEGVRPLNALLSKKLLPADQAISTPRLFGDVAAPDSTRLIPNKLGAVGESAKATSAGRWVTQAFGKDSRTLSRIIGNQDALLHDILKGKSPVRPGSLEEFARISYSAAADSAAKDLGVPIERVHAITENFQLNQSPSWISELPENEAAFARHMVKLRQDANAVQDAAGLTRLAGNGERYTISELKKMGNAQTVLDKARAKVAARLPQIEALFADNPIGKRATVASDRGLALRDAVVNALDPDHPTTMQEARDLLTAARKSRTAYGSSRVGEEIGPESNIRIDTFDKLTNEVRNASNLEKALGKKLNKVPARYMPMVRDLAETEYKDAMVQAGVDPEAASRAIITRDFSAYPEFSRGELNNLIRDAATTWQDLKAAGADPMYVHHVTDSSLGALRYPRAIDFAREPTASKARSLTAKPDFYTRDISLSLAHEGIELLSQRVNQAVIDEIVDTLGMRHGSLLERYRATAEEMARRNPSIDPLRHAEELAKRAARPYSPESFKRFPLPNLANPDQIWLPRAVIDNLARLHDPNPSALTAWFGGPTKVFRGAVLGLSLRFAVNNVFGNALIQLAENGPMAFKHWNEAHRLIEEAKTGSTEIPIEIRGSFDLARKEIADNPIARESARGQQLAEIWNRASETRAVKGVKYVMDKNYDLNAFFDDHNRLMSYLYGKSKALKTGMTEAESHAAGLESAYRTSMFWHDLTPIERNVLRQVFPFYAFTSKMLRFVTRYPFDHPARAAILSNITRAEIADQKDGLGYNWLNSIGLGPVHSTGHQLQLSLTGLNPFYDVANQYTLQGFLGNLNPVIESVLEAGGIGPGQQYANQTYDPIRGKLQPTHASLPSALLSNLIPQTKAIDALLHPSSSKPGSAPNRAIAGALGLPTSIRDVDVPAQYFTAELAREKDQAAVLKAAMASGDYSTARQYPALVPLIDAIISARDNGLLTAYNPSGSQAGILDVLAQAGKGATGG